MGRAARWIRCHINPPRPRAPEPKQETALTGALWWAAEPLPRATVHPFSLFRHLRDSFRCYLSLVHSAAGSKQRERRRRWREGAGPSLRAQRHHHAADVLRRSFLGASAGIKRAVKGFNCANESAVAAVGAAAARGRFLLDDPEAAGRTRGRAHIADLLGTCLSRRQHAGASAVTFSTAAGVQWLHSRGPHPDTQDMRSQTPVFHQSTCMNG